MKVEIEHLSNVITTYVLTIIAIIVVAAISAYAGSLVFLVYDDHLTASIMASMLTGGVLWMINNRLHITREAPSDQVRSMDLGMVALPFELERKNR